MTRCYPLLVFAVVCFLNSSCVTGSDPWYSPLYESKTQEAVDMGKTMTPVTFWVLEYDPDNQVVQRLGKERFFEITKEAYDTHLGYLTIRGCSYSTSDMKCAISFRTDKRYFLARGLCYGYSHITDVFIHDNNIVMSSFVMTRQKVKARRVVLILELDKEPDTIYMDLHAAS